jgi:hypothetical protein
MGKYIQDVVIYGPHIPVKGMTLEKRSQYDEQYAHLAPILKLLSALYNYYLPCKYETGHLIWRFNIHLEEQTTGGVSELGLVADAVQAFDNTRVKPLPLGEKKAHLLDLIQNGILSICQHYQCSVEPWEAAYQTIQEKGIQLSEVFRKPKWSPNRTCLAKLYVFHTEVVQEVSLLLEDQAGNLLQRIKVSEDYFLLFDEITWKTSDRLHISYINANQSYKRKKVSDDYFEVGLDRSVKFVPVTSEMVFKHALTLLALGEDYFQEASPSWRKHKEKATERQSTFLQTFRSIQKKGICPNYLKCLKRK